MSRGREDECLAVIAKIRSSPPEYELVQLEYLEVKAQHRFEVETSKARFPQYHAPGLMNEIKLGFHEYLSLLTNRSLFKRVVVAVFIMVFQQCTPSPIILHPENCWRLTTIYRVWRKRNPLLRSRKPIFHSPKDTANSPTANQIGIVHL